MKKIIIIRGIVLGTLLGGCAKRIEQPVIFDNYSLNLKTKYTYQEVPGDTTVEKSTLKQYVQEGTTGFRGSLVISKIMIQTEIDLKKFVEINGKSMLRKISGAKKPSTENITIDCVSGSINGVFQRISIDGGEEIQYLNQLFFIDRTQLYGVSSITVNKNESRNFTKSIKSISCFSMK